MAIFNSYVKLPEGIRFSPQQIKLSYIYLQLDHLSSEALVMLQLLLLPPESIELKTVAPLVGSVVVIAMTRLSMVYGGYIYIANWVCEPTYNGVPQCHLQ